LSGFFVEEALAQVIGSNGGIGGSGTTGTNGKVEVDLAQMVTRQMVRMEQAQMVIA